MSSPIKYQVATFSYLGAWNLESRTTVPVFHCKLNVHLVQ